MSSITINGQTHGLPQDPRTTLLDFMHQHLQLFGAKKAVTTASAAHVLYWWTANA